ncbi:hypothetical protein SY83_20390 [Paenibacillus swuensis]|uniref:AraC family transcriptional regulator n=1 Tax=Paenibacillus swuensis TaxID=1178515 RepID=A0A172TN55_9BACL|nr:response regulator [Paenibacillus swuensis]ANE48257.1 hypothetical protein SY83_20390 [Paenibacillus swuensis]
MIRILIVEDEFLVRVGLKTFVPWDEHGFHLIGEAANGIEALQILEQSTCDIILTDISMPVMDGLTLLEQVKMKYPHMKSIILSNLHDFQYVRRALQLGSLDYVLKLTMEPEELQEKLLTLKAVIEKERSEEILNRHLNSRISRLQEQFSERRFCDIITKMCSRKEIEETFRENGYTSIEGPFYLTSIKIGHYQKVLGENKYKSEKLLGYSVSNVLQEVLKGHMQGEYIELEPGTYALLTQQCSIPMLEEMRDCVARYLKLTVSFGISCLCADIYGIHNAYEEAETALQQQFYMGMGHIVQFEPMLEHPNDASLSFLKMQGEQWTRRIEQRDEAAMLVGLEDLYRFVVQERRWHPETVKEAWIELIYHFSQNLQEIGGDIYSVLPYEDKNPFHAIRAADTMEDIYEWLRGWIPLYLSYVKECSNKQWRPEIQTVVKMILEQYATGLKVSDLARAVNFTDAYLSVLFKKETGETIIDCIIRHKMRKAREMLKDPSVKIYEVSDAIGYTDPNYFAKLFKKVEGIYPLEFRKKYLNN